ncbi:MAG: (Fe-S)-binding protein [Desulfarculaceae bacterium]|nr:(Fe-S)-binding protein [Desulfarculaceae bacterium]MCF8048374.1 (Fe-S)-binding protein [Desulfarculaceae bacterium]MCF8066472.1 (Fe-S)-binding protein [Desulfarculaceae bacterium]MCF8099613.1 (Fe-S)-binding protein [Desulfarculaceae bacterium]MCF8124098.1 (Fe-S)-binding protein [Desulfarculaceae bacterium]
MQLSSEFRENFEEQILQCSQCGFCQAVCPLFAVSLRPAFNARGKMMVLKEALRGKLALDEQVLDSIFQCTACANCSHHCPSGVDVPGIVKAARREMSRTGSCHPAFTGLSQVLAQHGNIYAEEDPPEFQRLLNQPAEYVYFAGCVGNYREEEASETVLDLLDRLELNYSLIDEVCCGGVLEDMGLQAVAALAQANLERILATGARTVITGCPYCARTFLERPEYQPLRDQGIQVLVLSQLLAQLELPVTTDQRVTYHDPCDLGRHCGIYREPRQVIAKIAPDFVELAHNRDQALCCGAGGGMRGAYPKNSLAVARRRLEEVEQSGAEVLLTDCNSCVHNLRNAKLRKQKIQIYTLAEYIGRLLEGAS